MAQMFARVELRGTPGDDVYQRLHQYMLNKNWYREINGGFALPHAVYQAQSTEEYPNVMGIAQALKSDIERTIWTRALILVIRSEDWAKTAA